jgi:hypothetical protein
MEQKKIKLRCENSIERRFDPGGKSQERGKGFEDQTPQPDYRWRNLFPAKTAKRLLATCWVERSAVVERTAAH